MKLEAARNISPVGFSEEELGWRNIVFTKSDYSQGAAINGILQNIKKSSHNQFVHIRKQKS